MSERARGPRTACDSYAPLLALRNDLRDDLHDDLHDDLPAAAFDPAERAAARDHLAGCARCQADQRAYARLDGDLRRAFGPGTVSPLRTSDLLAAIGATSEPAAPARAPTAPRRAVIRSVIYLGDFDGGFDSMSEQDERADDQGEQTAPARKMAAIPSLRPGPRKRAVGRRWAAAFGATAAAVALIVVAVTLFATHARPPATQTAHSAATQTASAQGAASAANLGEITAISMDSPTDGWALGNATGQGSVQNPIAALYHFDGSQWTLKQRVKDFSPFSIPGSSLTMLSANDGWAYTGNLLHYDGVAWRPTRITVAGNAFTNLMAFKMASPTQGWAVAYVNTDTAGGATPAFLRYDGRQWSVDKSSLALPADLDPSSLQITRIAAAPGGEPWAIGSAVIKQPTVTNNDQAGPAPQVGLIFHRVNGVWRLETHVNLPNGAIGMLPNDILMTSPTSGWIVGQTSNNATMIGGGATTVTKPLLLRYDGASWTAVAAPPDVTTNDGALLQIVADGPDNLWVSVQTNGATIGPNGVGVSATLLHYDGKSWSEMTPALTVSGMTSVSVNSIGLTPDGQLWAVGSTITVHNQQGFVGPFFCLYANGVWSVVTPTVSGA